MKEEDSVSYSLVIGAVYIFNLIVGTGALTMPKAFQDAGYILSSITLTVLCFLSYVTSTFVIESMSISNGLNRLCKLKYSMRNSAFTNDEINQDDVRTLTDVHNTEDHEINKRNYGTTMQEDINQNNTNIELNNRNSDSTYFEITEKYEMGEMAMTYFNRVGLVLFYLTMCIYLYGDLAVYAAAVPNSLRDVACTYSMNSTITNITTNSAIVVRPDLKETDLCWVGSSLTRNDAYRIFLTAFVLLVCPFVFFNISKTKLLQLTTLLLRWAAFILMIILISIFLGNYGPTSINYPPVNFSHTPDLFGICVYSFMCHHSLPSLVTPIKNKRRLYPIIGIVFIVILAFYLMLCLLSNFCFDKIQSLITLNFEPMMNNGNRPSITKITFFQYFLSLFPVFSITTSFPIIGITLRNNLRNLITCGTGRSFNSMIVERIFYPLLAIIPPIILAYLTHDLQLLVGFTGSYAGSMIQYVIPAILVLIARRHANVIITKLKLAKNEEADDDDERANIEINKIDYNTNNLVSNLQITYTSPFSHRFWVYLILIWAVLCVVFVTVKHVLDFTHTGSQ